MNEIYVAKEGRESGPFQEDQIVSMLDAGILDLMDSVWHQGLTSWIPVYEFLDRRPPLPASPTEDFASVVSEHIGPGKSRRKGRSILATVLIATACILGLFAYSRIRRMQISGEWLATHLDGVARSSFWDYDEDGKKVLVTMEPDQPWFDWVGQVTGMELTRGGDVLLWGRGVDAKGAFSISYSNDLTLTVKKGSLVKTVVFPIEIESGKIMWIYNREHSERIGRYELMEKRE